MLYRYFLIAIACAALLMGIQVPGFVDQYSKRLDAHLREVTVNLRGFEEVAERHHGGSFESLLREHEASSSPTFRDEAKPLRAMLMRREAFLAEQRALDTHLAGQAMHIALAGNPELLHETQQAYGYVVPLSAQALTFGAVLALAFVVIMELVALLVRYMFRRRGGASSERRPS